MPGDEPIDREDSVRAEPDADRPTQLKLETGGLLSGDGLILLGGHKDEATRLFTVASSDCPLAWSEWEAADAELKALGVTPLKGKR